MVLPCKHKDSLVEQVEPTIDLLENMDTLHPDVLEQHNIQPSDYNEGLIFRSAIESIRGTYIASSTTGRQELVRSILLNLKLSRRIADYTNASTSNRWDFTVLIEKDPDYPIGLEVKGGEGNSINISERPLWAKEFGVWCHLDGAIVNQPAHGAHSILNRLTNEMVLRKKHVDVLFFKDAICGTRTRPCPKYPATLGMQNVRIAPDIFLLPKEVPSKENPQPPVHTLDSLRFPKLILDAFGVSLESRPEHIWEVHVRVVKADSHRLKRITKVIHKGSIVDESKSRAWRE
jgi:hypothetical protein